MDASKTSNVVVCSRPAGGDKSDGEHFLVMRIAFDRIDISPSLNATRASGNQGFGRLLGRPAKIVRQAGQSVLIQRHDVGTDSHAT